MKDVSFLGGKEVGAKCLECLLARMEKLAYRVTAVLPTPRGTRVRNVAKKRNLNIIESLKDLPECDLLISVQYDEILRPPDIAKAREIAVNLHMAPLPEYRGCNQFSLAIINDDKQFGVTLHQLTKGIDSGPIISEKRFPIPENIWVHELVEIATQESVQLFNETLDSLIWGTYELTDQEQLIQKRGTSLSYRKDVDKLRQIDLNWNSEKINRFVRALSMPGFEPPYAILEDGHKVCFCKGK